MKKMIIGCAALAAFGLLGLVLIAVFFAIGVSRQSTQASAGQLPAPTSTPVRAPTAGPTPLPKPGQVVTLTTSAGLRLVVTAHAVFDPSPTENQFNKAQGRWVVVDWTVRNEGLSDQHVSASWLKLQTESGYVVESGNHAGHREPSFASGVLGPGQLRRGFLAYDTPSDQRLKTVIFQSPGNRQFVIADLAP